MKVSLPSSSSWMGTKGEIIASIVAYSFCSGTLVVLNKLTLYHIPYPSIVVSIQLASTLLFIFIAKQYNILTVDEIQWKFIKPYLYYTILFFLVIFSSMKSLSISNVETNIVFKAATPCFVSILDVLFLGREYPNIRSWIALVLIIIGAYGYAIHDTKFQTQGYTAYFWPFLYLLFVSFEMAYGKRLIGSVKFKTHSGPVLYSNMLGFWPFLFMAYENGEFHKFYNKVLIGNTTNEEGGDGTTTSFNHVGIYFLLLGCIAGTGISYSSWWCRDKVSATSFTLIGVMNKCLTVILNLVIWDQHAPPMGIASLFICLVGGTIYEQAPMRAEFLASDNTATTTTTPGGGDGLLVDKTESSSNHESEITKMKNDNNASSSSSSEKIIVRDSKIIVDASSNHDDDEEQQPLLIVQDGITLRTNKTTS